MQTFLPHPGFRASALTLDARRLGKQRVEALQVLRGLVVPGYGWRRHPAVRMWAGYEEALVRYGLEVCKLWCEQGYRDTCANTLVADLCAFRPGTELRKQAVLEKAGELPPWLGDTAFHRSHQSALVRKDPAAYAPLFPGVPDDLPYVWPSSDRSEDDASAEKADEEDDASAEKAGEEDDPSAEKAEKQEARGTRKRR